MKNKIIILLIMLFVVLTAAVCLCPQVTLYDRACIVTLQRLLKPIPIFVPLLCDCVLYSAMIALPIAGMGVFFVKKKRYVDLAVCSLITLLSFLLNCVIKPLVHRPRPPYELQQAVHPESFSYVSSHSLVTCCLWGLAIYYIYKFCPVKKIRKLVTAIAACWILFVGLSRVWLGVHNPTDVIAAYLLAVVLIGGAITISDRSER